MNTENRGTQMKNLDRQKFVVMHQTRNNTAVPQPGRAKDNSPAIYRWVSG